MSKQFDVANKYLIDLGRGVNFELLEPESFGQSISLTQIAEVSSNQGTHELIFVLEVKANKMTVVGLLPNGTRVFSIFFDGKVIESEGYSKLIDKLEPKYLIADIQISLWPLEVLEGQWLRQQHCFIAKQCAIQETRPQSDGSKSREIFAGNDKLVSIHYSGNQQSHEMISLINVHRGYQITLESAD